MDMTGKTVMITGASRGIGAEAARVFAAAGANVALLARSQEAIADLAGEIGQSAIAIPCNVARFGEMASAVNTTVSAFGGLDVLLNNASSFFPTPIGSITMDDWNNLINSNMKAPLFLSQAAAPYLKETQGCIINMVDVHAQRPMKEHPVYCAAKAGLSMITLSLAKELGPEVRVNGVAPGAILWPDNDMPDHTKQIILERTALKRPGEPMDIAKTILFLVKDANYITGQIIAVDGGRTLNI